MEYLPLWVSVRHGVWVLSGPSGTSWLGVVGSEHLPDFQNIVGAALVPPSVAIHPSITPNTVILILPGKEKNLPGNPK